MSERQSTATDVDIDALRRWTLAEILRLVAEGLPVPRDICTVEYSSSHRGLDLRFDADSDAVDAWTAHLGLVHHEAVIRQGQPAAFLAYKGEIHNVSDEDPVWLDWTRVTVTTYLEAPSVEQVATAALVAS